MFPFYFGVKQDTETFLTGFNPHRSVRCWGRRLLWKLNLMTWTELYTNVQKWATLV